MVRYSPPGVWAIVPVKPFREGKSRLAGLCSPQERDTFNRSLLTHTLGTLRQAHATHGIVVVSRDADALAMAEHAGCDALAEEPLASRPSHLEHGPEFQLNAALAQTTDYVVSQGATAVLILPTDIPHLTVQDVHAMTSPQDPKPQILIAPSRDGGTNALFLQPAQAIPFAFGQGSFRRHQCLAEEARLPLRVVESASLAFDVDLPQDYVKHQWAVATLRAGR